MQTELIFKASADEFEFMEKTFRLEEITALLNALCGGYLDKVLKTIYTQNTELDELWKFNDLNLENQPTPQLETGENHANQNL